MTEGDEIDKTVCLSVETDDSLLTRVRRSTERTIDGESYSWNVARVLDDGTVKCAVCETTEPDSSDQLRLATATVESRR